MNIRLGGASEWEYAMGEAVPLRPVDRPMREPSASAWADFSRLMTLALKKPKDFEFEVATTMRVIEAHRQNSSIMRARGSEYDEAVALEREKFANWFESIVAAIRMQIAGR